MVHTLFECVIKCINFEVNLDLAVLLQMFVALIKGGLNRAKLTIERRRILKNTYLKGFF